MAGWDEYAVRWTTLHGGMDPRQARPSVERWLHMAYRIAKVCARLHIRPALVTSIGLAACTAVPLVAGRGRWWTILAALAVLFAAVTDTVDGSLAVLTSRATRLGYVYDSVVDRVGEACWLLGMWRIGVHGSVVVAAGALSWLHEYARARANAAGMTEIGAATLGERPTRVLLAVLGFALAGLFDLAGSDLGAGVATFTIAVWVVFGLLGILQLFSSIHRSLAGRSWPSTRSPAASSSTARSAAMPPGSSPSVGAWPRPNVRAVGKAKTKVYRSQSAPARQVDDDA